MRTSTWVTMCGPCSTINMTSPSPEPWETGQFSPCTVALLSGWLGYVWAMQYHKHDLTLARTMGDRSVQPLYLRNSIVQTFHLGVGDYPVPYRMYGQPWETVHAKNLYLLKVQAPLGPNSVGWTALRFSKRPRTPRGLHHFCSVDRGLWCTLDSVELQQI